MPSNVGNLQESISKLTESIRNSLPKNDKSLFDIKDRVKAAQTFSKIPGQDIQNKQAEFLEKKMEGILKSIRKDSIRTLKNKKEELDNIRSLAEKTLGGGTEQGRGIYEQYSLITKGLNNELKSRQQLGNKIAAFLKKNQIDAISITAALTTRNPIIGLGIKYILEQRKASKEAAQQEKHNSILDSIAYRNYLQHLLRMATKPKHFGGRKPRSPRQERIRQERSAATQKTRPSKEKKTKVPKEDDVIDLNKEDYEDITNKEDEIKDAEFEDWAGSTYGGLHNQEAPYIKPPLLLDTKEVHDREEAARRVDLPPKMLGQHVYEMPSVPYEMPPKSPTQDKNGRWHDEKGHFTSVPAPPQSTPEILKPIEDLRIVAVKISKDIEDFHEEDSKKTDEQLISDEEKKESDEKKNEELIKTIKLLEPGKSTGKELIHTPEKHGGILKTLEKGAGEGIGMSLAKKGLGFLGMGGKMAAGGIGGAEGAAGGAASGIGKIAAAAGSPIAMIGASLLLLAVDAVMGVFKSKAWGVDKTSAGLGGMMGGSIKNQMLNTFTQMGKWALIGATAGSVIPGLGTLVGGLLGAAFGAIMGFIGGEKIANFIEKSGIGRFFESLGKMLYNVLVKPLIRIFKVAEIGVKVLVGMFEFVNKTFIQPVMAIIKETLQPILAPLEEKLSKFFGWFSDIFDWISKVSDASDVDKMLDDLLANKGDIFGNIMKGFQQGFLDFAAGLLEMIPNWVPGSGKLHNLAKNLRGQSDAMNGPKTTTNGSNTSTGSTTTTENKPSPIKGPIVTPPIIPPTVAPITGAIPVGSPLKDVPSASGGADLKQDTLVQAHAKELILPKNISDEIRSSIQNKNTNPELLNTQNIQKMHIDDEGINDIKQHETSGTGKLLEKYLSPYPDPIGLPTIGYGHKIKPGEHFTKLSQEEAEDLLKKDIPIYEKMVKKSIKVPLTQEQFNSLVDLAYNTGGEKDTKYTEISHTMSDLINQGKFEEAGKWIKEHYIIGAVGSKKKLPGLVTRRSDNANPFLSGNEGTQVTAIKPPAPQTGRGILDATKHNEDIKAQQANNQNGNTIVAPTTNNSTTTAHLSMPQQDPQNTDNTSRDSRHRNQFGG